MDETASDPKTAGLTGLLLVNLGTPDSPAVSDVRKYLRQFLLDARVIDIPALPRQLLVNGWIAPTRAPKSAAAYRQIWDAETGSPLKYHSLRLEALMQQKIGPGYAVRLAMRYQNPAIADILAEMRLLPLKRLIVVPLFPQYASASTGSVVEEVMAVVKNWLLVPDVHFISRFCDHHAFIEAFAEVARPYLAARHYDRVLFSYHGLPERQILKGDTQKVCELGACCDSLTDRNQWCYRAQCFATTRLLAKALGLPEGSFLTSFQSRLGRTPWIKPYTDEVIPQLRKEGVESVAVLSPSFVADCLETILEIGTEYRELFESLGGKHWQLIPSLNEHPAWVEALKQIIEDSVPTPLPSGLQSYPASASPLA